MPGFSSECGMGQHQACTLGFECRCSCHTHTQALLRKAPPAPVGWRAEESGSGAAASPLPEVFASCPVCGARQKPTDNFCRVDGTRLLVGKQCLECGAPGEPGDKHCWQCGIEHGKVHLKVEEPQEDPLVRAKKKAIEAGLLKETVVS